MIKQLVKLANDLDSKGFTKEADALDGVINKISIRLPGIPTRTQRSTAPTIRLPDETITGSQRPAGTGAPTQRLTQEPPTGNPGSAFSAAVDQGNEAREQQVRAEITAEIQKTVDWFNNEVIPAIRSGDRQMSVQAPESLLIGFVGSFDKPLDIVYRSYIDGGQTVNSPDQRLRLSLNYEPPGGAYPQSGVQNLSPAKLSNIYNALEKKVIDNNIRVTMVSDVSDELERSGNA